MNAARLCTRAFKAIFDFSRRGNLLLERRAKRRPWSKTQTCAWRQHSTMTQGPERTSTTRCERGTARARTSTKSHPSACRQTASRLHRRSAQLAMTSRSRSAQSKTSPSATCWSRRHETTALLLSGKYVYSVHGMEHLVVSYCTWLYCTSWAGVQFHVSRKKWLFSTIKKLSDFYINVSNGLKLNLISNQCP